MTRVDLRHRGPSRPRGALDEDDVRKHSKAQGNSGSSSTTVFGLAVSVIAIIIFAYFRYQQYLQNIVNSRLDSPNIIGENSSLPSENPDRFWGTYRPHVYFGMKARVKKSPVFGLMWLEQLTNRYPPALRHWCNQDDDLESYVWKMHDGRSFGSQEIREKTYTVTTDFVKQPGGSHGGQWSARIKFSPKDANRPVVVSSFFYAALDGNDGSIQPLLTKGKLTTIKGYHEALGEFVVKFPAGDAQSPREAYLVSYAGQLDKVTDVVKGGLAVEAWDSARSKGFYNLAGRRVPRDAPGPNLLVKQLTAKLPFTMEVVFQSGSASTEERKAVLAGEVFNAKLQAQVEAFNEKFERVFELKKKGYKDNEISFAKAAMSNMVGGIGYFHGSSLVQSKHNDQPIDYWEAPLYTAVPSRPFFPRGFLWDEGFHNLLISMWDVDISKDIIGHWMDLMNTEGWIPREQILGVEARAKVPSEFVVQRNTNANPPTFFLPIQVIIKDMLKGSLGPDEKAYLSALYPRLKVWFNYYNTTQTGELPFTYRWHGRDPSLTKQLNPLTLTSGLDDYPRASHPTDDERHVDLRCWIALASGVMADIAKSLNEDWQAYEATHKLLSDNKLLDSLHWSESGQQYSDFGLHTDKAKLEKPKPPANLQPGQRPPQMNMDKIRVVHESPKMSHVNALGYVSLFPFLTKIVSPDSPKLRQILADIKNPQRLWTDFGLRSVSRNSKFYGRYNTEHDPPYWRGAIWINMNYLALSALHHYSEVTGPYQSEAQSIYRSLRNNLVKNILGEFQRTGYIWENYNDKTGQGKGTRPFTGWSALVVLMMAEKY